MSPKLSQFVDDNNDLVTPRDATEVAHYQNMGYRPAGPSEINAAQIKAKYSGFLGTAEAFGVGAARGVPGLLPAASYTYDALTDSPQGTAATWANNLEQAHPTASMLGETAGSVAAFATGEGALAKAGLEGAGLVAQASRSGLVNALLGYGKKEDNLLMQHAISPAGDEHVFADLGLDDVFNAAIGAAIPVGIAGGKRAVSLLGKAGDALSAVKDPSAILDVQKVNEGLEAGRQERVMQTFEGKGFDKMSTAEVRKTIAQRMPDLEAQYNDIKANATVPLDATSQGLLGDSISRYFVGDLEGQGDKLVSAVRNSEQLTLEDLHKMRQNIDARINYAADEPSLLDRALYESRSDVSRAMHMTLEANDSLTNQARSATWKSVDSEYSHLKQIDAILGQTKAAWKLPGLEDVLPAQYVPAARMLGMVAGFKGYATYKALGGAISFAQKMNAGGYREAARSLGGIFNKQATVWSKALAAGLYGAPEAAAQLAQSHKSHDDFDTLVAKSRYIMRNPVDASANVHTYMSNLGADPDTATKMVGRVVAVNSYLQGQLAQNSSPPSLIPTPAYMPEEMKKEWIGQYNTAHDPTYALTDPSAANLALARQFYPEWYSNTSQAIVEQLQANPDLPLESRLYASRILGFPVDPLCDATTYQLLQQGRQAAALAQAAQQQQKPSSSKQGSAGVDSTELQHLQGGDDDST